MTRWQLYILIMINLVFTDVKKTIIKSNEQVLRFKIDISVETESDLFPTKLLIGLPSSELPSVSVQYSQKDRLPFISNQFNSKQFDWINQQRVKGLETATLAIYPFASKDEYYKEIFVELLFNDVKVKHAKASENTNQFLSERIINWNISKIGCKKATNKVKHDCRENRRMV